MARKLEASWKPGTVTPAPSSWSAENSLAENPAHGLLSLPKLQVYYDFNV